VALARHHESTLTPALGAGSIKDVRTEIESRLLDVFKGRLESQDMENQEEREERMNSVHHRVLDLLDSWIHVVNENTAVTARTQYQKYEDRRSPAPKPLLVEMLEEEEDPHRKKFKANRSLRDVEPEVHLYLKDRYGASVEADG